MTDVQLWLAIAQIVGVGISIFVLLEMRAQRRTTYRPRLTLDSRVIWLKEGTDDIPFASDKQDKMDYSYSMHDVAIPLRNIGLGTAHEVFIEWQYDLSLWRKELLPEWKQYIEKRDDASSQYFYKPKDKDPERRFGFVMKPARDYNTDISNVRPDVAVNVSLPDAVLNAVCFSMHSAIRAGKEQSIIEKDYPLLRVIFKYRDISNRRRMNLMEMRIHARCYTQRQPYLLFGFADIAFKTKK